MVEWGAPDSDGGAPLEGYKVAVRDAKRQMWMEVGRVQADVQKLQVKDLAVSQFISEKRRRLKFKNKNSLFLRSIIHLKYNKSLIFFRREIIT